MLEPADELTQMKKIFNSFIEQMEGINEARLEYIHKETDYVNRECKALNEFCYELSVLQRIVEQI